MTDLLSVVDEVGTPAYVYDLAELRVNHRRLRAALPGHTDLYYTVAANPHPELLRQIRIAGVLPVVRSPGELDAALVAGWSARDVLYSGPGRRDADLDWALRLGVRGFTVDSPAALDQVTRHADGRRGQVCCLLRVDMSGSAATGTDPDLAFAEPFRFAGGTYARVYGLHVRADSEDAAAALARRLTSVLTEYGVRIERVGFAGFAPGFAGLLGGRARVSFEVDSELVGTVGTLVTVVLDVRAVGTRQVVVLASGVNHVGAFTGRDRRSLVPELISRAPFGDPVDTALIGPQETPLDVWAAGTRLPRLRPGDVLAVRDVGAWGATAGLVAFAAPDVPAEVVIDRDDPDTGIVHVSRLSVTRYP